VTCLKVQLYSNRAGSVIDMIYGSFETFRLAVAMHGGLVANAAVQQVIVVIPHQNARNAARATIKKV
jgi:hypothetical protein